MTINLKYMAALAGLALASGVNAQQISKPLSSLAPNSNPGTVLCRGGNGTIPMTSDEEQSFAAACGAGLAGLRTTSFDALRQRRLHRQRAHC